MESPPTDVRSVHETIKNPSQHRYEFGNDTSQIIEPLSRIARRDIRFDNGRGNDGIMVELNR